MKFIKWLFPWMFEPEETKCKCGDFMRLHKRTKYGVICTRADCLCVGWEPCVSRADRRRHLAVVRKQQKRAAH